MSDNAEIVKALDQIAKILTGIALSDLADADQIQKIARLKACGLQNAQIAKMLGTTRNTITINVAVHSLKKRKRKPAKKSPRRPKPTR